MRMIRTKKNNVLYIKCSLYVPPLLALIQEDSKFSLGISSICVAITHVFSIYKWENREPKLINDLFQVTIYISLFSKRKFVDIKKLLWEKSIIND